MIKRWEEWRFQHFRSYTHFPHQISKIYLLRIIAIMLTKCIKLKDITKVNIIRSQNQNYAIQLIAVKILSTNDGKFKLLENY